MPDRCADATESAGSDQQADENNESFAHGRPSCDLVQQPFVDVVPIDPNVPGIVDPGIVDVPGQGMFETLGTGTPMGALTPGEASSVEPSGIVLPPGLVPSPDPEEGVTAMLGEPAAVPEGHVLPIIEPSDAPPPSKVDIDPATPLPVADIPVPVADIPVPVVDIPVVDPAVPPLEVEVPVHSVPPASGLIPPLLSSVAPSGMPTGPDGELKFIVPSGDVAPMPGMGATCAKLVAQPKRKTAPAVVRTRRIKILLGGDTRSSPWSWVVDLLSSVCLTRHSVDSRSG
jgi:hypothetical protein